LAVGLALRFIASDVADNFLGIRLQLGRLRLMSLGVQRRNKQKPNYQRPVHKFPVQLFRSNASAISAAKFPALGRNVAFVAFATSIGRLTSLLIRLSDDCRLFFTFIIIVVVCIVLVIIVGIFGRQA